ncbi:MAG: SDR family oxidoreductase [Deltaproteobacteria bacterium]|nr:SDR family oxidoreductase [Deltaproteobacteria bacterium]
MRGKTILLTGASSGFGRLAVPMMLDEGHTVIAAMRGGEARLREIFADEVAHHGGRLVSVDLHMERSASFADVARKIDEHFGGRLDVLVNNAGYGLLGPLEDQTEAQIRHQFEVNVFGPVLLTKALLPALRRTRGRVLFVGSIAGSIVSPFYGSYAASKHAIEAYAESLRHELTPVGVQVALVSPGSFKTEFAARSLVLSEGSKDPSSRYHDEMRTFERSIRSYGGRGGDPSRVARLITDLCERARIPLRTLIGPDAKAMSALKRTLPDRVRFAAMNVGFRKIMLGT